MEKFGIPEPARTSGIVIALPHLLLNDEILYAKLESHCLLHSQVLRNNVMATLESFSPSFVIMKQIDVCFGLLFQAFAQLLQVPHDEAQALIQERFPVPRLVVCDQHGSQVSIVLELQRFVVLCHVSTTACCGV